MKEKVIEMLNKYYQKFPNDMEVSKYFEYLEMNENAIDRRNWNGHLTVSAFILDSKNENVLTLWHRTFQKNMQPGGHIDPPDLDPFEAVIREVKEETGLDVEKRSDVFKEIPISLDAHPIKANPIKKEEAHIHFDMCFWLNLKDNRQVIKNEDEGVDLAGWTPVSQINESSNNVLWRAVTRWKQLI